ncbi:isocitrate lyase/phosphoenolpyruvate mutase family protein [Cellulomonas sp. zg-ZUI22]|uniref:isocitrate lyase/PEP mutase family protein n=1 Tax=Cellulomonas sp. zg-ZUI22 TaxID=2816955 RepID=UPI001A95052D|nr:isocitrate lyase/phosphoenolpyruvate mutase family protein [Cellulomonas sp. zg-ZUI22]MBO0901836.1 isocitrate lyase/phosphoenolpyruvate mutase family protein [Cellulomonas sp. zg-ZUI22]
MTATSGEALRALHRGPDPFVLPNAWDVASALALVRAGFAAVGTTSLGLAAGAGVLDGSRAVRRLTADLVGRLAQLPVPVTADVEDGFDDDPRTVASFVASLPVAGVNLEDSTGGRLVDPERHADKIAAVRERCPLLVVNARVDTFWLGESATLEATTRRAQRYVRAGADCVFVPGALDAAQIRHLVGAVGAPLNVLATPVHPLSRLAALGVRRVSTGSLLYRAALDAAVGVARRVRDDGLPPEVTAYGEIQARTECMAAPGQPAEVRPGRGSGAGPWSSTRRSW